MKLENDLSNETVDARRLIFDILNFSKNETLIFKDFDEGRELARKLEPQTKFPPAVIMVPPGHMCSIPDDYYIGCTQSGKSSNQFLKVWGTARPLRRLARRFGGRGTIISKVMEPDYLPKPLNDQAMFEIQKARVV